MPYMKSSHITKYDDAGVVTEITLGESMIFSDSQFFLAKDGTWLMVDWVPGFSKWYVTEGV